MENNTSAIQVGFGVGDITADWPIGLQGMGDHNSRIFTETYGTINLYCVAITDTKGETALIMSIDAGWGGFGEDIFPALEEKFGIPRDHMILSALHQHSTPHGGERYEALLVSAAQEAVEQALADAGMDVLTEGPYADFSHWVEQAVDRDVVIARKPMNK